MATILEFKIAPTAVHDDGSMILEIQEDAEILNVGVGGDGPILWAKVDPNLETVARKFFLVQTGKPFPEGAAEYIGSWGDSPRVWHLFEGDM